MTSDLFTAQELEAARVLSQFWPYQDRMVSSLTREEL
jgi:hypothetical protein